MLHSGLDLTEGIGCRNIDNVGIPGHNVQGAHSKGQKKYKKAKRRRIYGKIVKETGRGNGIQKKSETEQVSFLSAALDHDIAL